MKKRTFVGAALSLLLVASVSHGQTATSTVGQSKMRQDSTARMGMMRMGPQAGMMGTAQQQGKARSSSARMMGMSGSMMGSGMGMMGMGESMGMMSPLHSYVRTLMHSKAWLARLKLPAEQAAKIEAIRAEFLKRKADVKADLEKTRIDLNLLTSKEANASKVKPLLQKYYADRIALEIDAYKTVQRIRGILTPEQRKVLGSALTTGCMGKMHQGPRMRPMR